MLRIRTDRPDWIEQVMRWESQKIQDEIFDIVQMFRCGKRPVLKPYIGWFVQSIFSFVSDIYYLAYDYDNMTYVLYSSLSYEELIQHNKNKINSKEQYQKLNELLGLMPKSFVNWYKNGNISLKTANEFLNHFESHKFREIMRIIKKEGENWPPRESNYWKNKRGTSLEKLLGHEICDRLATFGDLNSTYLSIIIALMNHADETNFQVREEV